jgi:hypothetical protein
MDPTSSHRPDIYLFLPTARERKRLVRITHRDTNFLELLSAPQSDKDSRYHFRFNVA